MSVDGDTVREALTLAGSLPLSVPQARWNELLRLDALTTGDAPALAALARLEAAEARMEDAVSEIAEYSEADSPADLPGAIAWLIREDSRNRIAAQSAEAQRDTLAEALRQIAEALRGCVQRGIDEDGNAWVAINPGGLDSALAALAEAGLTP